MSFPIVPGKHAGEAIVTPAAMLAHRRAGGRIGEITPPDAAVICLQRGLPERMRRRVRIRRIGRLMGDLYEVKESHGRVVVLTGFGLGAPIVAAQAEELIALGATMLVSVALAGGLQTELAPGTIVLVESALRDEGTSHHYLAPGRSVDPDATLTAAVGAGLTRRGLTFESGRTWSTDAPYRETRDEAIQFQREGVLVVDMEMAALFAVAEARRVRAAGVLVVGDSLAGGVWKPPARLDAMEQALDDIYAAVVEVLGAA